MNQPQPIKEIYDIACQEKANLESLNELLINPEANTSTLDDSQTLLNDLQSTSKVAIWRLMLWVHSAICYFQQRLWFVFKKDVEILVESAEPGTKLWYQKQALKFQFGHILIWDGTKYRYLNDDPTARIITRAAVIDPTSIVRVKVAKSNPPIPLSEPEYLAFESYMNLIKFAGTDLLVVNLLSDKLKLALNVYINPLSDFLAVRELINTAINNYINNLPFNGVFILNNLINQIQLINEVINANPIGCKFSSATQPVPTQISLQYQSVSGYIEIDSTSPLDGYFDDLNTILVINLIPYV